MSYNGDMENTHMENAHNDLVNRLMSICQKMEEVSPRIRLAYSEEDNTEYAKIESAHFVKLDGKRIGRDIEIYGTLSLIASPAFALAEFAQMVSLIKAKGCSDAYEAVRHECSGLEDLMEEKFRSDWRDIFSITAKEKVTE